MRVVVALSGGVDSAVAAARVQAQGHEAVAVHLRTGVEAEGEAAGGARSCCGIDDARDARAVAAKLGIPIYVVDVRASFQGVRDAFVEAYRAGHTPVPCVQCNKDVKFGRLIELAASLGAQALATGHYARRRPGARGRLRLLRPLDRGKDQTTMLFRLDQRQLRWARFPLGDTVKDDVRREAASLGLAVSDKADSQELCFLPSDGVRGYLKEHAPDALKAGVFVDAPSGTVVGEHTGAAAYTRGQRRGLPAVGDRRYVSAVDPVTGVITMDRREALMSRTVEATDVSWLEVVGPQQIQGPVRVCAKVRHHGTPTPGWLSTNGKGDVRIEFDEPVFAAASGQSLVAYVGEAVLAGGTIAAWS